MEMKKCNNGHFFDASIYSECPYCKKNREEQLASGSMPLRNAQGSGTIPAPSDDTRTVALIQKNTGVDPVVGWLVCTEGIEKGKDYRLHSDNNYVGRDPRMDVCIRQDETVSRENAAIVSYDSTEKKYYLSPDKGRSIVRLNNTALFSTQEINSRDRISIGNTELMFIPLCGDNFEWNNMK